MTVGVSNLYYIQHNPKGFFSENKLITYKLLTQGYIGTRLVTALKGCCGRYSE